MNCFDGTFSMGKAFALAGEVGKALRNVVNFNGVSQYAVAPRVEEIDLDDPDLEFEVEWRIDHTPNGGEYILYIGEGGISGGEFAIDIVGNRMLLVFGGVSNEINVATNKGLYSLRYSNGVVVLYKDGLEVSSHNITIGEYRYQEGNAMYLAARADKSVVVDYLYRGALRDIKIWTGGDRNTGTLTRYYKMDEGWRGANNQVLVNSATELGEELSTLVTPFDTPVIGSQQDAAIYDINSKANLPQYASLLMRYTAINYIGTSSVGFSTQGGISSSFRRYKDYDFYGVAEYNASLSPNAIAVFALPNVDSQCTFTNVSVRQADGYGTYVGLTEASWTEEIV